MMKFSVFMAISLDGFIARENGDTSWLHNPKYIFNKEEDYGFQEFMNSVDYLVMGRNTFDTVKGFSPWPYSKKVIVLSNSLKEIPTGFEDKIELFGDEINVLIERFKTEGVQRIYVDGGKTIRFFFNQKLITDLTLNRIPIILSKGIPLFEGIGEEVELVHTETKTYPNNFVMTSYVTAYN